MKSCEGAKKGKVGGRLICFSSCPLFSSFSTCEVPQHKNKIVALVSFVSLTELRIPKACKVLIHVDLCQKEALMSLIHT